MVALEQALAWVWRFEATDLNNPGLDTDLVESICLECDVDVSRRSDLALLIAEVINNALDHGVLGLDSALKKNPYGFDQYFVSRASRLAQLQTGFVSVSIHQLNADMISICVEDSGDGFDYQSTTQSLQSEPFASAYGRGLLIINHLCESVVHLGCGNCIVLEFKISSGQVA